MLTICLLIHALRIFCRCCCCCCCSAPSHCCFWSDRIICKYVSIECYIIYPNAKYICATVHRNILCIISRTSAAMGKPQFQTKNPWPISLSRYISACYYLYIYRNCYQTNVDYNSSSHAARTKKPKMNRANHLVTHSLWLFHSEKREIWKLYKLCVCVCLSPNN